MKTCSITLSLILAASFLLLRDGQAASPTVTDEIALVRSVLQADRQRMVADTLQLTETEAQAFWPLYHRYRAEMETLADGLLELVQEYAGYYPNIPDDRARQMLKDLTGLQKRQVAKRTTHLKKFAKVLPAAKNLRFAQVENRLDLALQLRLAAEIPITPIEGRIPGDASAAVVAAEGVAGGAVVQTLRWMATVIAINQASRKVTLLSRDGIKQTIKVPPDAVNFGQLRIGDSVTIEATEELVVQMAGADEFLREGSAAVVALEPKGAKPGGVIAEVTQVSATIAGIDLAKRRASLRFEDGSTKEVAVRDDVDLGRYKTGDRVVFKLTEMVAVSVVKP